MTADDWTHPYSREQAAYPAAVRPREQVLADGRPHRQPVRRSQPDLRLPADGEPTRSHRAIWTHVPDAGPERRADARGRSARPSREIGIPSLVLMENAGRQVVAAIEAALRRSRRAASRRPLRARQQRRRRLRRRAHAAAARRRRRRCSSSARVAEVKGDARINLEILGRLGMTVVEIADEQAWELHFSEMSAAAT